MDKRIDVISALFEKNKKRKPKKSQELQDFVKSQGGDEFLKKVDEYIEQAEKEQTKQAQKAQHGAKLQYLKSLKNKCNEDEELVYYKKGGTVDCGCKKKMEEGGQTPKKKNNVIEKFKNKKSDQATKDSIAVNNYGAEDIEATRPGIYKKNKQGKIQWTPDRTKAPYKKECGGRATKKGSKFLPKIKKVDEEKCGGVVKKFKKHYNGGSLNRIPFIKLGLV